MTRTNNVTDQLQTMIKEHGLLHIICALDLLCNEQATWRIIDGDIKGGAPWAKASKLLQTLSHKINDLDL